MPCLPKFLCIKDKNKASSPRSYILEQMDDTLYYMCQMNPSESLNTLNCNLIRVDPRRVTENTDGVSLVLPARKFLSHTEASLSYWKTIKANEPAAIPKMSVLCSEPGLPFAEKSHGWVWALGAETDQTQK